MELHQTEKGKITEERVKLITQTLSLNLIGFAYFLNNQSTQETAKRRTANQGWRDEACLGSQNKAIHHPFFVYTSPPSAHSRKNLRVSLSNCDMKANDQNRKGLNERDAKKILKERIGISGKEITEGDKKEKKETWMKGGDEIERQRREKGF